MFEEEEWNDAPEAEALPQTVVKGTKLTNKSKGVGKKSLLRTLQALGSVPVWSNGAPREGSESETEAAPSHTKRKKKRCKKRKRASTLGSEAVEREQDGEEKVPETAVKKLKPTFKAPGPKKVQKAPSVVDGEKGEKAETEKEKGGTGENVKEQLSRKHWKNKMRNKRKCKNKYQQNEKPAVPKAEPCSHPAPGKEQNKPSDLISEKQFVQTKTTINNNKQTNKNKPKKKGDQRRKKAEEEKAITPSIDTDTITNNTDLAGINTTEGNALKAATREPSSKGSEPGDEPRQAEHKHPPNPCEQRKRKEKEKERRIHAEKLRRMLKSQAADAHGASPEETAGADGKEEEAPVDRSAALRARMEKRLEAARFRYINEVLYTTSSGEAKRMFKQDPQAFGIYHRGFTTQVQHWPANPVDAIISYIRRKPASLVVADFGCGDCKIARSVKNKVHSFDLAPVCDHVTVCDMAKVPLGDATVDIAVFCLSLMGTNLSDFLAEANRVLVMGGVLKIAEVASRFENVRSFLGALSNLGFKLVSKDTENSHFHSFDLVKIAGAPEHVKRAGLELKPCVYKKR